MIKKPHPLLIIVIFSILFFGFSKLFAIIAPITDITASSGTFVGAVKLTWTYPDTLTAGSSFYIQYSTNPTESWNYNNAQIVKSTQVAQGGKQVISVGGLDIGRDETDAIISPHYYFRGWLSTGASAFSDISNGVTSYANTPDAGTDILTNYPDGGWLTTFNDANNDDEEGWDIAIDNSGNIYIIGSYWIGKNSDIIIRKYNSSGVVQWTRYYNSPTNGNYDFGYGIAVDNSGNVYVSGTSSQGVTGQDIWVRKYDTNGLIQWTTTYNTLDNSEAFDIAVDGSKNVYVIGDVIGNNPDIWIRKYDTNGLIQWTTTYNSTPEPSSDFGRGIAVDNSGNVYVTGCADPFLVPSQNFNIWVRKYSQPTLTSVLVEWTTTYNSPTNDEDDGYDIAVDDSGNVYVTGKVRCNNLLQDFNIWTRKYGTNGLVQWTTTYNSPDNIDELGYAITLDPSGNVYVTGSENRFIVNDNIWVRKYDTNGLIQWTTTYNGPANSDDKGWGIAIDDSENVYATGFESVTGQGNNIWLRKYVQASLYEAEGEEIISPSTDKIITKKETIGGVMLEVKVNILAGAVTKQSYIEISVDPLNSPIVVDKDKIIEANNKLATDSKKKVFEDTITEFVMKYYDTGNQNTGNFNNTVKITLSYPDATNDGYIDGTNPKIKENALKVHVLNEKTNEWEPVGGNEINPTNNSVTVEVRHFSVYALISVQAAVSNLNEVKVYPNPYKPGATGKDVKFDRTEGIRFDNLTDRVKLRIFNIAGELVFEKDLENTGGSYDWLAVNNNGDKVANGVYIYYITKPDDSSQKAKGRIAIVR